MFAIGSKVKYTDDYIRENFDKGVEQQYASTWRGIVCHVTGYGCFVEEEDEIQEFYHFEDLEEEN